MVFIPANKKEGQKPPTKLLDTIEKVNHVTTKIMKIANFRKVISNDSKALRAGGL